MLLVVTYKPTNLDLQHNVHVITVKFVPQFKGHILFGISDKSDNEYLCTEKEQDMVKIQAEFKRSSLV